MGARYYQNKDELPELIRAIDDRIAVYICSILYPDEPIEQALDRYILSDIGAGATISLGDSIEHYLGTNVEFPFTGYNFGEISPLDDGKNTLALSGKVYDPVSNSLVKTKPMQLEMLMVTFFGGESSYGDYIIANKLLHEQADALIRLWVPIILNGTPVQIPITIEMEITRGNYTAEFEQHMELGDINDVVHNLTIRYFDFILDIDNVAAIDDIHVFISMLDEDDLSQSILLDNFTLPDQPKINSTSPNNGDTDIDPDHNISNISVQFNVPMNKEKVRDAFTITPYVNGDFVWNDNEDQVIYDTVENFQPNTEYFITINKNAQSIYSGTLDDHYTFGFTTGS